MKDLVKGEHPFAEKYCWKAIVKTVNFLSREN
jgi:hypothetical protein